MWTTFLITMYVNWDMMIQPTPPNLLAVSRVPVNSPVSRQKIGNLGWLISGEYGSFVSGE